MELKDAILKISEDCGSFYIYDEKCILDRIEALTSNFKGVDFIYSIKCNAEPHIVKLIAAHGIGADAASIAEISLAGASGMAQSDILYSAPGKEIPDIQEGLKSSVVIADSLNEIRRIEKYLADGADICADQTAKIATSNIGIRINPNFTFENDEGVASKFGVDEDDAIEFIENEGKNLKFSHINGIHVHVKSQVLSEDGLIGYYQKILKLTEKVEAALGYKLDYINMGSGIGIRYAEMDKDLDIEKLGQETSRLISGFKESHPSTRIIIESGRFLVGQSGYYVTHVVDQKVSHGRKYVILKNTLNGFLRPSIARLIEKYAGGGELGGTEPLYSGKDSFQFLTINDLDEGLEKDSSMNRPKEIVTLVGNLCTAADVIAEDIMMPELEVGDAVIIPNAGSYAAVLSLAQFSSQFAPENRPAQFLLTADGETERL